VRIYTFPPVDKTVPEMMWTKNRRKKNPDEETDDLEISR